MKWLARHRMGVLGFAVAVAYVPHLLSPVAAPRWAVLALGVPLAAVLDPRSLHPWALFLILWTAVLGAASLIASPSPYGGMLALMHFGILCSVAMAAAGCESLDDLMDGTGWGLLLSGVIAAAQMADIAIPGIEQISAPAGLFLSSGVLGEFAAMVFAWALLRPRWALAVVAVTIVVVTHSRIGILICGATVVYAVWHRSKVLALAILCAVAVIALWSVTAFGKFGSFEHRLVLWASGIFSITLFGQGLGWFEAAQPRLIFAHSDVLQAVIELGIAGIVPFLVLPVLVFKSGGDRAERALFIAACIAATVSFPLHLPASGFLAAAAAGFLLRVRNVVRVGEPFRRVDDELYHYSPAHAAVGGIVERGRRAGAFSVRLPDSFNAPHRARAVEGGA